MVAQDARVKQLDTTVFWHIILPSLSLVILLFVVFVIYTMPDWALTCSPDLLPLRKLAARLD
jgi:hypothetical protein